MEENTFASFKPITSFGDQDTEELKRYYMENNLTPDNSMLKKYLGWPDESVIPVTNIASTATGLDKMDVGQLLGNLTYASPTAKEPTQNTTSQIVNTGPAPKNKKEFLEKYEAGAIEASKQSGVAKDLLLAQVALETGWGKHAPGFNLGGIKSGKSWKGKTQTLQTTEYENGKYVKKPQTFRAYDSDTEGFKGYVDFLMSNSRYHILKGISDPYRAAEVMGTTGYATDINYTPKLKAIIKQIQST